MENMAPASDGIAARWGAITSHTSGVNRRKLAVIPAPYAPLGVEAPFCARYSGTETAVTVFAITGARATILLSQAWPSSKSSELQVNPAACRRPAGVFNTNC